MVCLERFQATNFSPWSSKEKNWPLLESARPSKQWHGGVPLPGTELQIRMFGIILLISRIPVHPLAFLNTVFPHIKPTDASYFKKCKWPGS